jgi:hypothetical protein
LPDNCRCVPRANGRVHQQVFRRDKPAGIWLFFPSRHSEVAIGPRGGKPILPRIGRWLSTAQEVSNRFPRDQSGRQGVVLEFRLNAPFAFAQAADQPDHRAKNRGRVPLRHPSPVLVGTYVTHNTLALGPLVQLLLRLLCRLAMRSWIDLGRVSCQGYVSIYSGLAETSETLAP